MKRALLLECSSKLMNYNRLIVSLEQILVNSYCIHDFAPSTREFCCFTREFWLFTREFCSFTREFSTFTREFILHTWFRTVYS
ncbi:hypothetical protein ACFX4I_09355 [Peribacillus sp. YIM B13472]|uniref:hypothetical protein n=1 Tax=Peribacillus sp. YIM B13472 TaxID=3366297 RepID=UPI00366B9E83